MDLLHYAVYVLWCYTTECNARSKCGKRHSNVVKVGMYELCGFASQAR